MRRMVLELGNAQRPLDGESEMGDLCVVKELDGRVLVGVIDGVGHGGEAARAAAAAAEIIETHAEEPLDLLMRLCHERLVSTRGAAITLVLLNVQEGVLEWVGTGNVAAVRVRKKISGMPQRDELFARGGVAGGVLPSISVSSVPVAAGDLLVLATDGLRPEFVEAINGHESPQPLAERLLAEYHTARDDALVCVARVRGTAP